jgi:hypothetical protein
MTSATPWSGRSHTDRRVSGPRGPLTAGTACLALPGGCPLAGPLGDGTPGCLLGGRTPRRLLGGGPTCSLLRCRPTTHSLASRRAPRRLLGGGPTGRLLRSRPTTHGLASRRALDRLARSGTALDGLLRCLPRGRSPGCRLLCRRLSGCFSSHPSSRYYHRHHPHLMLDYMTEHINGSESCACQGGCLRVARATASSRCTSAPVEVDCNDRFVTRVTSIYRRDEGLGLRSKTVVSCVKSRPSMIMRSFSRRSFAHSASRMGSRA